MTLTDFRRMERAVEHSGIFRVYEPGESGYTEVRKDGPLDYVATSVYPGSNGHVSERYVIAHAYRLSNFKEFMIH